MPRPRAPSPACKDLQSPISRLLGLNHGDSPGEVELSQDIVWDSNSPTHANRPTGDRNTRVDAISYIVDRLAPKDVKPDTTKCHLLQWIGDGAVPCTPHVPRQRPRKKSFRQNNVEDLLKLARQFDENMQQDSNTSEQLNDGHDKPDEPAPETKPTQTSRSVSDAKCPSSSSEQVEAEFQALFDSSTQRFSGRLSQCSTTSARLQEVEGQSVSATPAGRQQPVLKSTQKLDRKGSCVSNVNKCDDFEDDWGNDDLLNDSFVLAMTQNPNMEHDANIHKATSDIERVAAPVTAPCEPTAITDSAHQPWKPKPTYSTLQELCPKLKTTNRSTFRLQPNPHFQAKMAKGASKCSFTAVQPRPGAATTKTSSGPQPDRCPGDQSPARPGPNSVKDTSDSLWDDGDVDALLYQLCDDVERISNVQTTSSTSQKKPVAAVDRLRKSTQPRPAGANTKSPCAFVRSNSLPGTSWETANYQGWNVPMKGASSTSRTSQSFPGSRITSGGPPGRREDPSGNFQPANASVDVKLTAGTLQSAKSQHTAFKRHVSDSAVINSKVFVTSRSQAKCSAVQIERKKQEALARRRLRLQNASNPKAAPS